MTNILLVEDDARAREVIVKAFTHDWPDSLVVHEAETIARAKELFQQHGAELDLILMDACVPGNSPNTMGLVKSIRDGGFSGPMICISSLTKYGAELMEAGCNSYHTKRDIAGLVIAAYDAVSAVSAE